METKIQLSKRTEPLNVLLIGNNPIDLTKTLEKINQIRGRTFDHAMETAAAITSRLGPATASGGFAILGPAPAPLARLRGEHRVQFFLKGARRADMRNALQTVLGGMPEIRRRVTIDVDPLSVL